MRAATAPSGRFLPAPSALSSASSSEVNSWPPGIPRKVMPVGAPSFTMANSSLPPSAASVCSSSMGEHEQKSVRKPSSSPAFWWPGDKAARST